MIGIGNAISIGLRRVGGFVGLLDLFPNAAAAYSLRKLRAAYSGSAVRVRRSSDNTEQDIGFTTQGELDTASLLSFVNEDVVIYQSDFSLDEGDWSNDDISTTYGVTHNGETDVVEIIMTNGNQVHQFANPNLFSVGQANNIQIKVFIPSTNSELDSFLFTGGSAVVQVPVQDEWVTYDYEHIASSNAGQLRFRSDNGINNFIDADGDKIYIKFIVVTQTTADGLVSAWYDQLLSNDATQSTATNQPKIVSGGSLVTENGKAAVGFDGTDDYLNLPSALADSFSGQGKALSSFNVASVVSGNRTLYSITNVGGSNDNYYFSSHDGTNFRLFARGASGSLKSSTSTNTFAAGQYLKTDILPEESAGVQNGDMYIDSAQEVSSFDYATATKTLTSGAIGVLLRGTLSGYYNGNNQELILYPSDQSSNRTAIESNQATFYGITI